jgi:transposase
MSELEDMAVGIDVAKAVLDVAVRPSGEERHLAIDPAGIADIVGWMKALSPQGIAVEATGGDEALLVASWALLAGRRGAGEKGKRADRCELV